MPQVTQGMNKKLILNVVLMFALLLALAACGSSKANSSAAPYNSDTGSHPDGWVPTGHMNAANANIAQCAECHGSDYSGGIAEVSCTSCHIGGVTSVHPTDAAYTPWVQNHKLYISNNAGTSSCANGACHGSDLSGVAGSGPSCTSCHPMPTSIHPTDAKYSPWIQNHKLYVADSGGTTVCANGNCHGSDLSGVAGSGPSCTSCHIGGPTSVHPSTWTAPAFYGHNNYALANGTSQCQNAYCHGSSLTGVAGSGPSCTSCHLGGTMSIHPASFSSPTWTTQYPPHGMYVMQNYTDSCENAACHGANLQGVPQSGPACQSCHATLP